MAPLNKQAVINEQTIAIQTAVNFCFFGDYSKSRFRWLTVAIVALFISSLIGVVDQTVVFVIQFTTNASNASHLIPLFHRMNIVMNVSHRFNYLVGDLIVVWRAWVVWPDSRTARFLLVLCICGSVVGTIINSVWQAQWTLQGDKGKSALTRTLTITVPLLATNFVATVLMGIRLWTYRRNIKSSLGGQSRLNRVEGTLLALVETSFLYCALWVLFLVTGLQEPVKGKINIYGVIQPAYHTIAGIYPTFIVLLVATKRSTAETYLSVSEPKETLRFTPGLGDTTRTFGQTVDTRTNAGHMDAHELAAMQTDIRDMPCGSRTLLDDGDVVEDVATDLFAVKTPEGSKEVEGDRGGD
ncbi:hypothetical protein GGG16DRAFT_127253 [Schizophyllum commune]